MCSAVFISYTVSCVVAALGC